MTRQEVGLRGIGGIKNFLSTVYRIAVQTFIQKTGNIQRSKICLQRSEWFSCFQMFHGTRDFENMSIVKTKKDFIMQNCSAMKWTSVLQYA
jgi:hypothetical protein